MVQPAGMVPGVPTGSFAPSAYPDYVRLKELADQSARQAAMAAMTAPSTRGNLNPQPAGDNPLSAYVRQRNDSEQKMIMDKASRDQNTSDTYNKLLLTRTDQVGALSNIAASSDEKMAMKAQADKMKGLQDTLDARDEVSQRHEATNLEIAKIHQQAQDRVKPGHPPSTKELVAAKDSYFGAQDLYNKLEDVKGTITDSAATDAHTTLAKAPGFIMDAANGVAKHLDNFENTTEYKALMSRIATGASVSGDRALKAMFDNVKENFPHNGINNASKRASIDSYQKMALGHMRNQTDVYGDALFNTHPTATAPGPAHLAAPKGPGPNMPAPSSNPPGSQTGF